MRLAIFGIVIVIVFTVFVTAFASAADSKSVRNLPKWLWVLLCLFTSPIGGICYLLVGRPLPTNSASRTDDPSYLRRLADLLRDLGDRND